MQDDHYRSEIAEPDAGRREIAVALPTYRLPVEPPAELVLLQRYRVAMREASAWAANMHLERAGGSAFHRFVAAMRAGDLLYDPDDRDEAHATYARNFDRPLQIFVVEHDWAAAFRGATDFDALGDGRNDYRLPYPECCFEFRISGKRVCVSARDSADRQRRDFLMVVETSRGWLSISMDEGENVAQRNFLEAQIRAICVALEAEVAEAEIRRGPPRQNRARERRGRLPLLDYHVVDLARRRSRAARENGATDDHDGRRVRLHFRRGHWRHLEDRRIWIKWTLVGDPDLGFIDKHYRA